MLTLNKMSLFAASHLACVADLIYPRLVTSAEQGRDSFSGRKNELNESRLVRFEFPFNFIGKWQWLFLTGQSWPV